MEPRIQYARTKDGVSIAYWTLGEGMPLVHMPLNIGHIQMEWEFPECRDWYERLAKDRMLVRYDHRAQGLSDRENTDYSMEALVLELEALTDRLDLERLALLGLGITGPAAVAFAARHPERVARLILWGTYAKAPEWALSPQVQASRALVDEDWTTYTETLANIVFGWSQGQPARRFAQLVRAAMTPDAVRVGLRASLDWDVSEQLPAVRSPTLVIHRRNLPIGVDAAKHLSSAIPDARLALLDGESLAPYLGDTEAVLRAIDEFLGESEQTAATAETPASGAVRAVLFTDVVGHSEMMSRLGDARGREVLREHERITREVLRTHGGAEVKTMGDGFMASFGSVTKAVECAIGLQRAFAERNASVSAHPERAEGAVEGRTQARPSTGSGRAANSEPLSIRIGLNAGEPIEEEGDLFGATVILASRIAAKAEGGEILVANAVRELCAGKWFLFADRGEFVAKGFEEPVRVFEVRWR